MSAVLSAFKVYIFVTVKPSQNRAPQKSGGTKDEVPLNPGPPALSEPGLEADRRGASEHLPQRPSLKGCLHAFHGDQGEAVAAFFFFLGGGWGDLFGSSGEVLLEAQGGLGRPLE